MNAFHWVGVALTFAGTLGCFSSSNTLSDGFKIAMIYTMAVFMVIAGFVLR